MSKGITRPDIWEKAKEKIGGPRGTWDLYRIWREYWRLLNAAELREEETA